MVPASPVTGILAAVPSPTQADMYASYFPLRLLCEAPGWSHLPSDVCSTWKWNGVSTHWVTSLTNWWWGPDPEPAKAFFPLSSCGWTVLRHIPAAVQAVPLIEQQVTCGHGQAIVHLWTALPPSLLHLLSLILSPLIKSLVCTGLRLCSLANPGEDKTD